MVSDQIHGSGYRGDRRFRGSSDQGTRILYGLKLRSHLIIWAVVALAMVPVSIQAFDRREPMVFVSADAMPEGGIPGAKIATYYRGEYRRPDECSMWIKRAWVDARETKWVLAPIGVKYERGMQTIGLTLNIPMDATPGPLRLESSMEWSCNWLQRKIMPGETEMPDITLTVSR